MREFYLVITLTFVSLLSITLVDYLIMWQQSYSEIVFKLNVSKRFLQEIDGLDIAIIKKSYDSNTLFARLYNDIEQTSISIFSNTMNFIRAITTLLTFFIFLTTIHWLLALLIFLFPSLSSQLACLPKNMLSVQRKDLVIAMKNLVAKCREL